MSTDDRGDERSWARATMASLRGGALQATLVYLTMLTAFFWKPVADYESVHYSAADLTQSFSLTRIEGNHRPGNQLQSDAVTQMQPWVVFNRQEFAEGRFGLWNPYNGAGCPHFANYQSAVVSPFSVPFYVLSFKAALLVSAALKLLALALFTYLFLREIGLRHVPALFGGAVFAFAGHNLLLLYFPHVGAMFALPAGALFVEKAAKRVRRSIESGVQESIFGPLSGLVIAFVVGLLAGNPEPFYFSALFVAGLVLARIIGLCADLGSMRGARTAISVFAGKTVFAVAISAGLAAFQIVPFFEFLHRSRVYEQRSNTQTPLDPAYWPLALFPNVLGNPASPYKLSDEIPPPNYELINVAYTGGLATLLALLSIVYVFRDRWARFFAVAGAAWLFYAYDFFGAAKLFALIPSVDMAPMNRSQGVWNFIVACAAAIFVDKIARRAEERAWWCAALVAAAATVMLVACLIGADRLIERFAFVPSPNHDLFLEFVPVHLARMTWAFAIGTAAVALMWLVRAPKLRTALLVVVVAASFAETGWLLRRYNPVSEDRLTFPKTQAITRLKSLVGENRVVILGHDGIPPDSNLFYGISLISNYDGMWVRDYDFLYRDQFGDSNNWRPILRGTERGLRLFGVGFVLAKWDWNFLDNGLAEFGRARGQIPKRLEILPQQDVTQTFRARRNGLDAVMVYLGAPPIAEPCTVVARLDEIESGRVVFERSLTLDEVRGSLYEHHWNVWPDEPAVNPRGRPFVFRFDSIRDSGNKHYKLTLSSSNGIGSKAVTAWSMPLNAYGEGQAHHGKRPQSGELLFDFSYSYSRFEEVERIGDFTLYRLKNALPRYALVGEAVVFDSNDKTLEMMRSPSFDPAQRVVLNTNDEAASAGASNRGLEANVRRRVVQFLDKDWVYLVAADGQTLVHIDDEATFLANEFSWGQVEKLPASERDRFVFVEDSDREAKQRAGLRLTTPGSPLQPLAKVVTETPTRIELEVERLQTGYLVVSQTFFPGWKARLNGVEKPVLRANYAFTAVQIPPGKWNVELSYEPDSLRVGSAIGGVSALASIAAFVVSRRRRSSTGPLA